MTINKNVWLMVCLGLCLALVSAVFYTGSTRYPEKIPMGMVDKQQKVNARDPGDSAHTDSGSTGQQNTGPTDRTDLTSFTDWAVMSLKSDLAETIALKSSQAELIRFRLYLMEKHPKDWQQLFSDIIRRAFPDYAEEVFATLAKLDRYNTWFEDNKSALSTMNHQEIKDAFREKRHELFGDDANELWAEETHSGMIKDILDIMRDDYDTGINEKLALYSETIHDADQDTTALIPADRRYYLTRAFFHMDSVQNSLKTLSYADRAESIRNVRKTLGYSEADIEKLAKADAVNEARWQAGYRYMEERTRILAEYQNDEQQKRIADLQQAYFGKRAKTIQAEEASGFFRFTRPRVYGGN